MKKTTLFLIILTLIAAAIASARTVKYVEIGINQSKFRNENCKSKIGPSFGITFDYYPSKSFGGFFGYGFIYQNKKIFLENRTWPTASPAEMSMQVVTGNLDINISYLEIPVQIGYSFKIKNKLTSSFTAGYGLSIPIMDHSSATEKHVRDLLPDEIGKYDFDYVFLDETRVTGSINYLVGFRLALNQFALLVGYTKALSSTKDIIQLSIKEKMDTFKISLAYNF